MNAYELADKLLSEVNCFDHQCAFDAASMLRQQADRIKRLEAEAKAKNNYLQQHCQKIDEQADRIAELEKGEEVAGRFYWESVVDGHVMAVPSEGTPHYNKDDFPLYTTPQIKELSDDEIHQIFRDESGFEIDTCPIAILDFARAILKKASEK
jgi:hypothetical protein